LLTVSPAPLKRTASLSSSGMPEPGCAHPAGGLFRAGQTVPLADGGGGFSSCRTRLTFDSNASASFSFTRSQKHALKSSNSQSQLPRSPSIQKCRARRGRAARSCKRSEGREGGREGGGGGRERSAVQHPPRQLSLPRKAKWVLSRGRCCMDRGRDVCE
jgi:hypothetical protein